MKKIIRKFKECSKTKKIVIIYVAVSFVFIFGISLYNAFDHSFQQSKTISLNEASKSNQNSKNDQTESASSNKETDNSEENKESEETKENNETTSVKENRNSATQSGQGNNSSSTGSQSNNESTSQKTDTDKADSTTSNTPAKEMVAVHVQVTGINNTLMEGLVKIEKGDSAYTALKTIANQNGIKISTTGFGKMIYVRGIGNLFEKQHGSMSGWMYKVNGESPNYSAGSYQLNEGDQVLWYYANYE